MNKTQPENKNSNFCECRIRGVTINPQVYLKVINHDLRKRILHKFFALTINGSISKKQLADALGIGYHKLLYQLNEHLRDFWEVKYEKKIRGAHEEFIAPPHTNLIYVNIGTDAMIHVLDPLANLFGTLRKVGTRCDQCSELQIGRCLADLRRQGCYPIDEEEGVKQRKVLKANYRSDPLTPVDFILVCTALKTLERETCVVKPTDGKCPFIEKVRKELEQGS